MSQVIKSDDLPLYRQAAEKTGFELSVEAREGQQHAFWRTGLEEKSGAGMRTVTVPEGKLGITITRPADQKYHSCSIFVS